MSGVSVDLPLFQLGAPALYTLFLWWFSTGLILYLDGLPRRTFRYSMVGASALGGLAIYGLVTSSVQTSTAAAYLAFSCSLLVWGWNEMAFLMGFLTGPRRSPCPATCGGWSHLRHAIEAILYHELAIAASAALVVAATWEAPNQVGTWTFMVLWGMRLSTKLNVFLGVPNLTVEFLPAHLQYLQSFFSNKPMNLLFPLSVTLSTTVTVILAQRAVTTQPTAADTTGLAFLTTLMALAVLEHWFLVIPLPAASLWSWSLRSREVTPSSPPSREPGIS